jgi:hypothetical protein
MIVLVVLALGVLALIFGVVVGFLSLLIDVVLRD